VRSMAFSALLAVLSIGMPALAEAQTTVAIYRGTSEYDLSGVNQAPTTSIRMTRDLSSLFVVEGAVNYVELRQDFGPSKLLMPEVLLQFQVPIGPVAPYLGAGAGIGIDSPNDADLSRETDLTLLVSAGLRVELPYNFMLGADGRIRSFGTNFWGTGTELSVGVGYRF
jgi:hypothetical protein